jgi:hypothetical protein
MYAIKTTTIKAIKDIPTAIGTISGDTFESQSLAFENFFELSFLNASY